MFDFFGADGALGERLGIVEPGLFQAELAGGAALEVSDEHGILGALPFEIGGGDEAALKFLEAATGVGQLRFRRLRAGGDEDAVKTSLAGIVVEFAGDVFGDFAGGDLDRHGAFIAHVDHAGAGANGSEGVGFAGLGRADLQRTEVGAVSRGPLFGGNVDQYSRVCFRAHERLTFLKPFETSGISQSRLLGRSMLRPYKGSAAARPQRQSGGTPTELQSGPPRKAAPTREIRTREQFGPTQLLTARGIISPGLAWEDLFPFHGPRFGTGARFGCGARFAAARR